MRANPRIWRTVLSVSVTLAVAGCTSSQVSDGGPSSLFAGPAVSNVLASNLDIARTEFGRGNYGNAIEYLEKELAQKPASVSALNGLGACYDQLGRFDVAQRYYFRALDLSPESSQTLSNIGYSYLQQGRHREAVAVLELALQKNAGNQVAANNLSLARAGLDAGTVAPQVARSTNNGSQVEDEMDFRTLLSLLQGASGPGTAATEGIADGTLSESPDRNGTAVIANTGNTGNAAIIAPATRVERAASTTVRVPEVSSTESIRRGVIQAQPSAAVTATAARGLVDEPVLNEGSVNQQGDVAGLQATVETAVGVSGSTESSSPIRKEETATRALITSQAIAVTDVLEPVPAEEPEPGSAAVDESVPQLNLTIIDTPALDPARISDVAPSLATLAQPLNLVVQNGNGVRGIARATSDWLQGEKIDIKRVTDAENFDFARTVIYYRPELAPYAQEIATSLNLSCDLRPSYQLADGTDVQVVLGHDFASQVSVGRGGIEFKSTPRTDYLTGTIRLEISNGNGVNGMAARVREFLKNKGGNVVRISDADSYTYEKSLLLYREGTRIASQGLADTLPMSDIELVESRRLRPETDALLIIGADFVPFDNLVLN